MNVFSNSTTRTTVTSQGRKFKRIGVLALFFGMIITSHAQVFNAKNIFTFNFSNNGSTLLFKDNFGIGIDYLESRHFMLSSNIETTNKAERYDAITKTYQLEPHVNYIAVNTLAKFKYPVGRFNVFLGIGPSLNFRTKSIYKTLGAEAHTKEGDFISKNMVLDFMSEAGIFTDFNKIRLGSAISYRTNITKIIPVTRKGFIGHTLTLNLSVGYHF